MKTAVAPIREYTISEISADSGREHPATDFHVVKCEELPYAPRMFQPARSNHFSIIITTAGTHKVRSNLIQYTVPKQTLFIIPPGTVNQFVDLSEECAAIVLQFSKEFLGSAELHKKHIDAFSFFSTQSDPLISLTKEEFDLLHQLMLLLREKDLSSTEHPFRKEVILHGFNLFMFELAAIVRKYRENKILKFTRKEDLMFNFMKLLASHFKEERSVQFYADQLFVTPKHLSKTVKELTDKTSGELIDDMVITEAKILLDDSTLSVGNVADALHFSDQFFFSKFFKKHTGHSPTEYKSSL